MASLTDAFNDAFGEEKAITKFIVYAVPVFICAYSYLNNNKLICYFLMLPTILLLCALMSNGIHNIRTNKQEILTFNLFTIVSVLVKLLLAILPIFCVMFFIGYIIVNFVKLPFDVPNLPFIFNFIVWLVLFSVVFTAYLSFSKTLTLEGAYNLKVVFESSLDVLINLLFLIPQLLIANGILIGVVWYLFFVFKLPITSPLFVFYCSCVLILNLSALSSYFAQASYELIMGKDSEYNDNYSIKGTGSYNNYKK